MAISMKPSDREIVDFLREWNRIGALGPNATRIERRALQVRKVDLYRRMAMHPDPFTAQETVEVAALAELEAEKLEQGRDDWGEW